MWPTYLRAGLNVRRKAERKCMCVCICIELQSVYIVYVCVYGSINI